MPRAPRGPGSFLVQTALPGPSPRGPLRPMVLKSRSRSRSRARQEVAMRHESVIDQATGRKFYLDVPDDTGRPLTFLLNLHGGGSFGAWQRLFFPAPGHAQ